MEPERKQPARERLARAPELLVDAAPVLGGEEPAGSVRALADAEVAGVAAEGLERIDGPRLRSRLRLRARPFGDFFRRVPGRRSRLAIPLDLGRRHGDVPPAAAAAATLRAREPLLGVVTEGDHRGSVYAPARLKARAPSG